MTVTALLVSHGGASWLPAVLDGVAQQTVAVDHRVAVDTGSKDDSARIIAAAWGDGAVHAAPRSTSYGEAVEIGLEATDSDWVWLLHDDSNPAPTALAELLAAARAHPEADIFGPKLREWPSLRRLLELGITITGTGRRETGLERGEYDQGQHDETRRVLAVNTAGMLVRRWVLEELGGFDRDLPIFGNDLDFGWRAALAGRHTVVVPEAVVFHVEAAHRGLRQTPLTGRHTHFQERRSALFTLLANSPSRFLLLRTIRLAFGTFWRMLGFLAVRSVGQALDELAALLSIYAHPGQIAAARRRRRDLLARDHAAVKPLLAPAWLPYRHGLDFVSDVAAAVTLQAQDVAERRRAAKLAAEGGPVRSRPSDDEDELAEDSGLLVRFLTNPVAVLLALFVIAALVGTRAGWGHVSGGALSAAPEEASSWWGTYVQHWHPLLTGTDVPAPAYLLPMAVGASVLGGNPPLLVSLILVLAVPVALWGAWRFLRVAGHLRSAEGASRWLLAWGSVVYALVPVTSGAWGDGRLGTIVVAALLPWLAHAALGFGDPDADRRWRAGWRTALLLALVGAFAPAVWFVVLLVALVVLGFALAVSPRTVRQRSVGGPPLVAVVVAPLLLLPWVLPMLVSGRPGGLLLEAGRLPAASIARWDLLLGVAGSDPAPLFLGGVVAGLAVLALLPRGPRLLVAGAWIVALAAVVVALLLSLVSVPVLGGTARPGLGALVVVLQGAFVTAVVLGGEELTHRLDGLPRRLAGTVGATLLGLMVLAGTGWLAAGDHDRLTSDGDGAVPAYMVDSSLEGPERGVLILDGSVADGLGYTIRRGDGTTLGEDEIEALTPEDEHFTEVLQTLVSRPAASSAGALADAGIEYVVLAAPADAQVAATLDATAGLSQASASDRSTRAWHVDKALDPDAVSGPGSWWRTALVVTQIVGLLVVLLLCGPTRRRVP